MQLREDGITWRTVDDEVVVLDLEGSVYFKVNGTGRLLWERLASPATSEDLVRALREHHDVDEEQAGRDVEAFLADLDRHGLLDRS